jgi:hypothetical protein
MQFFFRWGIFQPFGRHRLFCIYCGCNYSASHSRVAQENVGLQKEENYNIFAYHTYNEMRLCVLGIRKKRSWQHEKIR